MYGVLVGDIQSNDTSKAILSDGLHLLLTGDVAPQLAHDLVCDLRLEVEDVLGYDVSCVCLSVSVSVRVRACMPAHVRASICCRMRLRLNAGTHKHALTNMRSSSRVALNTRAHAQSFQQA